MSIDREPADVSLSIAVSRMKITVPDRASRVPFEKERKKKKKKKNISIVHTDLGEEGISFRVFDENTRADRFVIAWR